MTLMNASLLAMSYAGTLAVGVLMAPFVTAHPSTSTMPAATDTRVQTERPQPAAMPPRQEQATLVRIAAVGTHAPALQARMKPVLASGTDVAMAASGFGSAEQFATVAYLSRNTGIPFVLLKHRVLTEGRTLMKAVQMSRPDVNAALEVTRARAEARAEIWAVG